MSVLLARYRRWLRLPASVVPGSIFMALFAGVTLWASTGWVDRWINDTPKPLWSWSSLPLVVLALLLWDGRKDRPAHNDGRTSGSSAPPDRVTN